MERYDNPFEFLAKDVSPIFKIVGKLYKSVSKEGKLPLTEYAAILSGSLTLVNSIIDLSEGIKAKTKTPADISAFVTNFASTCVTISGSIFKLAKGKSPLVLPIVAASLGLVANTVATLDGVTESDVKKIDKSILGLATAMGTTYASVYFPGNKAIPTKLGAVSSIISGLLAGWDSFQTTVKKYEDNGIPSEIAVKDAAINAFANLIHGAASSYTYGADDAVFHLTQSIASWLTKSEVSYKDKNYMEWIVDVFKTLNVSNTGTSGDDTLINDTNESYIYGEDGNDRISNFASGATLWGGSGKDTIFSHAEWEGKKFNSNSLLGGLGDDFISALDVMTTMLGGEGNDKLGSYGNANKLYGEAGNDIILVGNGTNKNTINGGLGNDIVILDNAKNAIIEYSDGDGNDIIYGYEESDRVNIDTNYETSISGDNVIIYVGTGLITLVGSANKTLNVNGKKIGGSQGDTSTSDNTSITLPGFWDSNNIVRGISIDDKINNTVNSIKINTTAGNDTITNSGSNATIMSGADDDYISNSGTRTLIDSGSGVDVIYNEASNVTINGSDGNDSIKNIGNNVLIEDDGGNDTITNSGNYVSINSDEDNDRITNSGDNVRVNAGNGNNYVSNSGNNVTIAGGSSADTVISSGNYASINAGEGNNSISISSVSGGRNSIETGDGNDAINIADRNESIASRFSNAIDAGEGNNYIHNGNVERSTIYTGSGNDTIITGGGSLSSSQRTSIIAGAGDNRIIVNTTLSGGRIYSRSGNDYVSIVSGGSENIILVGGGDDSIVAGVSYSTLNVGTGNNKVTLKAESKNNKIIAGKGDDYIMFENDSDNNTVSIVGGINTIYASNGRHTIITGDDSDLVTIGSGYVDVGNGENNVSLTTAKNRNTIVSGKDDDTIQVADLDEIEDIRYHSVIKAGDGNNYIYNSNVELSTISAGQGNDTIITGGGEGYNSGTWGHDKYGNSTSNTYFNTSINAGAGDNLITINTEMSGGYILTGNGNDLVSIKSGGTNTIYAGAGDNTIYAGNGVSSVYVGNGNDKVTVGGGYIDLGEGNNNIFVSNNNSSIVSGDGNDTVVALGGSRLYICAGNGNNVISAGSITGGLNTLTVGNGSDTIQIYDVSETEAQRYHNNIESGDGNNYIYNSNVELSTISAGQGNDTIITGGGEGYNSGTWGHDKYGNSTSNTYFNTSINAGAGDNLITINTEMSGGNILTGNGNDFITIYGSGSGNYIRTDGGNDTLIANTSNSTLRMGTNGNNRVTLQGNSNSNNITMGDGDNFITMGGNSTGNVISLGEGNNTIYGANGRQSITSGDKSTFVTIGSGYVSVGNGGNNISLTTAVNRNSIISGDADDTISVADLDENEDIRYHSIIKAGDGNNYIYNSNVELSTISAGQGNDTIITGGGEGYNSGTWGHDKYGNSTSNTYFNTSINAGAGDNLITINTEMSGGYILTDNGNDYVTIIDGSNNNILLGAGRNTIYSGAGNSNSIISGNGSDVIVIGGNSNSINAGSGRNYVSLTGGNNATVITGGGNDTIALAENSSGNVIIFGGGNDLVQNYHSNDTIKTVGSVTTSTVGNDVILTSGSDKMTLKGAKGKTINVATIAATGIDTTVGDTLTPDVAGKPQETLPPEDTLPPEETLPPETVPTEDSRLSYNTSKTSVTLSSDFTGTLNASGYASTTKNIDATKVSSGVKIYGNSLKNSIEGGTGNDTLAGGIGNDTLTGGTGKDVFVHSYGKDIITDYVAGTDKIKVEDGEVSDYRVIGSDVILYTDNGSVRVKNGKDKAITVIDEDGNETTETYKAAETIIVTVPASAIPAGVSVKGAVLSVTTVFSGSSLNLENYDATITKVDASKLSKAIEIVGNVGNNSIKGGKGADTINGGVGNDTLTGGNGKDIFVYSSGNDLITDYKVGEDKIKLNLSKVTSSSVKGSDVVLTTNDGNLTVKATKDKVITLVDDNGNTNERIFFGNTSYAPLETGLAYDAKRVVLTASNKFTDSAIDLGEYLPTVTKVNASAPSQSLKIVGNNSANSIKGGKGADTINGGAGKDTISGGTGNDSLYGGSDNDKLLGEAGNDTLNGGTGNDTLTGGAGNDVFMYEGGNDLITDYKPNEDKIRLNLSAITSSSVKGSDVILTTSNGTLTVKGTKDKVITFVDNNGKTSERIFFANTSYAPLETGLAYDAKRVVLTASNKFTGNTIDLGEYLGTITKLNSSATSQNVNIIGNSADNSIKAGKGSDTINGGNGKDTIFGGADNDSLYGGNDNDILNGEAGNDTLNGGRGNDTLTGGAGNDVFIYEGGNDVITDYTAGQDSIKVSGTISNVSYNGKNVVFSIGNGLLTVNNAKGKDITVTNNNNQTQTYSKTLDLIYDNNFVADEFGIDSISEVTETNYSVGKLEYSSNNNELANNSIVSASYFDEK